MRAYRATALCAVLAAPLLIGFDTSRHSIPPEKILGGGPAKDAIPAILDPRFIEASKVTFLAPDDAVIGVVSEGVAKAYPIRIPPRSWPRRSGLTAAMPWLSAEGSAGLAAAVTCEQKH